MRRSSATLAFAVVCAILTGSSRPAHAEDIDKQVAKMNKRAMDDYDSLEFESARKTLLEAVQTLRANGLDDAPIAAKTYANLGIVYVNGFKDRSHGVQQFVNALKIQPNYQLDPAVDTPELAEAFAAAKKQLTGNSRQSTVPEQKQPAEKPAEKPAEAPAEKPTPPAEEVHGLVHNAVDESRPGTPIPIRAKLGSDLGATKLILFYRGSGQEDFLSVPMKHVGGADWVGVIPAEAVTGRALQYYLEARDARGRAVIGSGSAPSPYIVEITETAKPPENVPEVDVEDPLLKERLARRRAAEEHKSTHDHLFVFVMPGFGFGVEPAGNHTEVAWQFQPAANKFTPQPVGATGVAVAPFHLAAEIGYLITPRWSVSVLGRFQVVTGANAQTLRAGNANEPTSKAVGAVAAFVRARYRFLDGRFHPYLHLDLGGGEIRHVLDISSAQSDMNPLVDRYTAQRYNGGDTMIDTYRQEVCSNHKNCSDTIALGYLFIGGGAGLWYDFASHFAFILDVNLLGGIGTSDRQSGFNIDVQVGLGAHFL